MRVDRRALMGPYRSRVQLWYRTYRRGGRIFAPFRVTGRAAHLAADIVHISRASCVGTRAWFSLVSPDASIWIGTDTTVGVDFTASIARDLWIGDGVGIGDRVLVMDHEHDPMGTLDEHGLPAFGWQLTEPRPVRIGDGVHIGVNVVIKPGVEIGDGSVVGANAVVTRSIPPRSVVAGVPARVLRTLQVARET